MRVPGAAFWSAPCPAAERAGCAPLAAHRERKAAEQRRRWTEAGIPPRSLEATLDFDSGAARRVRKYLAEEMSLCLVLLGRSGLGKTDAACAAVKAVGGRVLFAGDLLMETVADWSGMDALIRSRALLVLDDLGKERFKPGGVAEEKLAQMFHYRESHSLPTIVTSNLTTEKLMIRVGPSVVDRLCGSWGRVYLCEGESLRTQTVKQLTGILRGGVFYPAEPWTSPAMEQDVEHRNKLTSRFEGLSERLEAECRKPDEAIALGAASELLARLRVAGYVFTLNRETETISVAPRPDEQTASRLREHKPALLRLLAAEAPEQTWA